MRHPFFVNHERLYFQLHVYRRYFDTFDSLRKDNKKYLKDFNIYNNYSIQFFTGYLITHLAFLFDEVSEYSLVNSRFEVEELENKRLSLINTWNIHKDNILKVASNTGILKYEDRQKINSAYVWYRKMIDYEGDKIFAFMNSVAELHIMFEDFLAVELVKEQNLKTQRRKRKKTDTDSEGEELE